jgi:hypothetical protein
MAPSGVVGPTDQAAYLARRQGRKKAWAVTPAPPPPGSID